MVTAAANTQPSASQASAPGQATAPDWPSAPERSETPPPQLTPRDREWLTLYFNCNEDLHALAARLASSVPASPCHRVPLSPCQESDTPAPTLLELAFWLRTPPVRAALADWDYAQRRARAARDEADRRVAIDALKAVCLASPPPLLHLLCLVLLLLYPHLSHLWLNPTRATDRRPRAIPYPPLAPLPSWSVLTAPPPLRHLRIAPTLPLLLPSLLHLSHLLSLLLPPSPHSSKYAARPPPSSALCHAPHSIRHAGQVNATSPHVLTRSRVHVLIASTSGPPTPRSSSNANDAKTTASRDSSSRPSQPPMPPAPTNAASPIGPTPCGRSRPLRSPARRVRRLLTPRPAG